MTKTSQQPSYFIRNPSNGEVKGPLSGQQLKRWYSQGSFAEWGVSKSAKGPWTLASQVKGLLAPSQQINPDTQSSSPPVPRRTASPSWVRFKNQLWDLRDHFEDYRKAYLVGCLGLVALVAVVLSAVPVTRFVLAATSAAWPDVPDEFRQKSGEAPGAYSNRIAKEVFAGTWETQDDNSKIVLPDGSTGGINTERISLLFEPNESRHGTFQVMSTNKKGETTLGSCYTWKIDGVKSSFMAGTVARFYYFPTECPDAPKYGTPSYELMRIRLKNEQSQGRPVYEFVIKDKDTLIQKNATPFDGPHVSFGDQVWRRVQ